MTATTIPGSHPTHSHRPIWAALAFALAAVIGVGTAMVLVDDDGSSASRTAVERESTVTNPSASAVVTSADAAEARALASSSSIPVSADAAEARPFPQQVPVQTPDRQVGSADAAERAALSEQARDLRACAYYAAPAAAVERCLAGG